MVVHDTLLKIGLFLLVIGVALVITHVASRFISGLSELPPFLYVSYNFDGLSIGTSPILMLLLVVIYFLIFR
ncbi:MAG: hypothetical protein NZ920_05620 [Aigarchaeota archaeon]|nr:hypothetical protein [Aigarchaeota archaeon]MDW8092830.1 hypothetical protein [Nitrososphaerota archaeon]